MMPEEIPTMKWCSKTLVDNLPEKLKQCKVWITATTSEKKDGSLGKYSHAVFTDEGQKKYEDWYKNDWLKRPKQVAAAEAGSNVSAGTITFAYDNQECFLTFSELESKMLAEGKTCEYLGKVFYSSDQYALGDGDDVLVSTSDGSIQYNDGVPDELKLLNN